jgi:predicted nucleotidyltransferase
MDAAMIATLAGYFAGRKQVTAAYLFGSQARGSAGPKSDVDVGVVVAGLPSGGVERVERVAAMQADLEALLRRDVDLVLLDEAGPDLLHRVLRDGVLLHEGDHRRRLEFEVQARNAYFDLLPILQRYRRTVLGSL